MKFDRRVDHTDEDLISFIEWLETETFDCLKRSHGNAEMVKSCLFLYANRVNEAYLDEELIFQTLGKCIGRACYNEQEESFALDLFEPIHSLAVQVHDNA